MEFKNVIAIDAMGGDNAPGEIIKGAIDAINERADIKLRLFGDKDKIEAELHKYTYNKEQIEITHTTEEISCNEAPAIAIKKKKDSSLVVAIKSVKNGECDAIVSAGSSGAILVGGQVLIGKGKGVKRAPLAPLTPTEKGVSLLIDCGANVDARPEHLLQFAQMGSIYMEDVVGVKNPRVAIVNIGAEEAKGNALVKETYPLLKACKNINFIGSIEARDIPKGEADVIVTEAFVGNVILKLEEGLASTLIQIIKERYPDCAITLSIGEKSKDSYQAYYDAGADRYLLRHETYNHEHYRKLHPPNLSPEHRQQCLRDLNDIGYQIGCGFMVGSPYQTSEHLAEDMLFMKELNPHMIGIGPFIPHHDTPFAGESAGTLELTLYMLGLIRLMIPKVLLPATTALGTIHPKGRELGILAGANVVMPNLSPTEVRKDYLLYDNKICTGDEAAECVNCLGNRIASTGYELVSDRGDYK